MISKPAKLALASLFSLATLALIIYSGAIEAVGDALSRASLLQLGVASALFVGMRFVQIASFVLACKATSTCLSWRAAHDLTALKGFYNLGVSGAGLVAQAAHANATKSLGMAELAWATAIQSILLVSAIGFWLMIAGAWAFGTMQGFWLALAGGAATLSPLLLVTTIRSDWPPWGILPESVRQRASSFIRKADDVSLKGMLQLFLVQSALVSLRVSRVLCIALFLDPSLDIARSASITLSADLASVVPLTPGGLGIREFFIGLGANLTGQLEILLAAAVIDRGITILGNSIHGGWILARLGRRENEQSLPNG